MAKTDPYIEKAYNKLLHISEDEQKRLEYEERQKAIRDYNHLIYCYKEDGIAEGIAQETKHGIQILIETYRELSVSKDYAAEKLMQKYSLSKETAEDYLRKYWT